MVWKGVIIEESLEGRDLLDIVKVVATKRNTLKKEPEKGVLIFHMVELDDHKKDEFVSKAKSAIKSGWYLHICSSGKMIVVFRNRYFEFSKKDKKAINGARNYGISAGIIKEQMPFEKLIENPYG